MSAEQWRLGTHNPYTVYRVADGARDVEHAREHFVTSFRLEEDARRAVEAVNAAALVGHLRHYVGKVARALGVKPETGWTLDAALSATPERVGVIGEATLSALDALMKAAAPAQPAGAAATGPDTCDCHEDAGATHLTLVSNPKRRGGAVTIGHTGWRAEAAFETVRAGDALDAWVPGFVTREQAGLLERVVEETREPRGDGVEEAFTRDPEHVSLNVLDGRARDVARMLGDAVEDDDAPRWYDLMARVRSLASRPAPDVPVDREALVRAFRSGAVVDEAYEHEDPVWSSPTRREADRMAQVVMEAYGLA